MCFSSFNVIVLCIDLDYVEKLGSTQIGGQLPVTIWQFTESGNVTIRTIVTTNSCVPISEDILVNEKGPILRSTTNVFTRCLKTGPLFNRSYLERMSMDFYNFRQTA